MPKIKKVNMKRDEEDLVKTSFPRFVLKRNLNIDEMIKKYGLEKCRYIFVTKKYMFIVNHDYLENF